MVAHQGGWDEILFVIAPMAIFGGLLWLANKRADKQLNSGQTQESAKSTKVD